MDTNNIEGFISYDVEIVENIEGEDFDLRNFTPSIAAICTTVDKVEFFYDDPYMTKETGKKLVNRMMDLYKEGYIPFGWNTMGFDFPLLAHYTGMYEECAKLSLNSIDAMFMVVAIKGYYLGLNKVLIGANIEEKVHSVTLNDKSNFSDMSGAKAPLLWRNKEFSAVKEYLWGDVVQPLKLAYDIRQREQLNWTSSAGKKLSVKTPLLTVKECLELSVPDTSWLDKPKYRHEYYNWIPLEILYKELGKNQEDYGDYNKAFN